jgi:hypothetical protein
MRRRAAESFASGIASDARNCLAWTDDQFHKIRLGTPKFAGTFPADRAG